MIIVASQVIFLPDQYLHSSTLLFCNPTSVNFSTIVAIPEFLALLPYGIFSTLMKSLSPRLACILTLPRFSISLPSLPPINMKHSIRSRGVLCLCTQGCLHPVWFPHSPPSCVLAFCSGITWFDFIIILIYTDLFKI